MGGRFRVKDQKREYYRVRFPDSERPSLRIGDAAYEILDLSESGLYARLTVPGLSMDDIVAGVVRFKDGEEFAVEGRIVRMDGDSVGLFLDKQGFPYRKVLDEQRRLLATYPELRQSWRT